MEDKNLTMKFNFQKVSELIGKYAYRDDFDIYRYEENGIDLKPEPEQSGLKCNIYYPLTENPIDKKDAYYPETLRFKINTYLDSKVEAGDWIVARKKSESGEVLGIYEGRAGLPNYMVTHQEIEIGVDGET